MIILAEYKLGYAALHFAAAEGNTVIAETLLKKAGADVNAVTQKGWTPLHLAAASGNESMVKLLVLDCSANIAYASQ